MKRKSPGIDPPDAVDREQNKTAHALFRNWAVIFLLAFLLLSTIWLASYAVMPSVRIDEPEVAVIIPPDTSFLGIKKILVQAGIIQDDIRFAMLARLIGASKRLKAGEFVFYTGQTPYQVLKVLEEGKVTFRPVTIQEGLDIRQVATILADNEWVDRDVFLSLTNDPGMLQKLDIKASSLEGYLFPDTYYLARGELDEAGIIKMMVEKFKAVYTEITAGADRDISLTTHEIITLASIVEKETAQPEERPLVAGVFLNRLNKDMRLQADPTVIYGLEDKVGRLTRKDLNTPTPYNTYLNRGLPPGPIGNPGRASIEAVLRPEETEYLYFVSRNDGTHYFSKTLAEHNKAVTKYQK